jgi:leucyl/phenylalanyl-tRNA--protein transferase
VPIEPASPRWVLPDLQDLPAGQDLVAVGADLAPGMLLAGYRAGVFAMPEGRELGWWSPDPRGVLLPGQAHSSRSLRRALNRYRVSLDRAFAEVVGACADPRRPHGWISAAYQHSYLELHQLGWAHSIEVWDAQDQLAGGLFGVEVGGLFAAESMFHVRTDASKVAVVALAERLAADGDRRRIIDVQWCTEHLASLGAIEVPRSTYLQALPGALACRPALAGHAEPGEPGEPGVPGVPPSRIRWRRA